MGDVTVLYGVGATKSGTSWLYQALHDHPQCHLRSVKELHYWDSFDAQEQGHQLQSLASNADRLAQRRAQVRADGDQAKVANIDRRLADIDALAQVLTGPRGDASAYHAYLTAGATDTTRVVADISPSYGLLDEQRLGQMRDLGPVTKFVYLMRDPLARLWSHVRMIATRRGGADDLEQRANRLLERVLNGKADHGILQRGNYRRAIRHLRNVVPGASLMLSFTEELMTRAGLSRLARFLDVSDIEADTNRRVHGGQPAHMRDDLVAPALAFLRPQYNFVARHIGPLPKAWQDSLARAA